MAGAYIIIIERESSIHASSFNSIAKKIYNKVKAKQKVNVKVWLPAHQTVYKNRNTNIWKRKKNGVTIMKPPPTSQIFWSFIIYPRLIYRFIRHQWIFCLLSWYHYFELIEMAPTEAHSSISVHLIKKFFYCPDFV